MPFTSTYGFNGQPFVNVISANVTSDKRIAETSAPGVDGVNVFDLGGNGEIYSLTIFEFKDGEVEDRVSTIMSSMREPGAHNLKWHGRTFKAQFVRASIGPYSRASHARRVEITLEFRKDVG